MANQQSPAAVLKYNGVTGAPLGTFVTLPGGQNPGSLGFGPDNNLYVSHLSGPSGVTKYDGTSGALIGEFATGFDDSNGPRNPLFGPDGNLYVADFNSSHVREFDGTTGASLGIFASGGTLSGAAHAVFGPSGDLFVVSTNNHRVVRFDGTTGANLGDFVTAGLGGLRSPVDLLFTSIPVPEPSSLALAALGGICTSAWGRRRWKRRIEQRLPPNN